MNEPLGELASALLAIELALEPFPVDVQLRTLRLAMDVVAANGSDGHVDPVNEATGHSVRDIVVRYLAGSVEAREALLEIVRALGHRGNGSDSARTARTGDIGETLEALVLRLVREGHARANEIADVTGRSASTVGMAVRSLIESGELVAEGQGRNRVLRCNHSEVGNG